jgi:predicted AAA+ superfamily ATPase
VPNIFPLIRSLVDLKEYKSKFLILGSASPELLKQSSESLAGRIIYYTLTPFLLEEISAKYTFNKFHLRGGFPNSLLAKSDKFAFLWLENFISTFLERDLKLFGFDIPSDTMHRLWRMLAHCNGQLLNSSKLGNSMGLSHTTIRKYIDILKYTYMTRVLKPYHINIKKRLVKSPKIYVKDTGILHSLLKIYSYEDIYNHPVYGSSFETMVIENIISKFKDFDPYFYRNSNGNEIDLLLVKGQKIIAIKIKASTAPKLNKGFFIAIEDVKASKAFVIGDIEIPYQLKNDIMVYNLEDFLKLNL